VLHLAGTIRSCQKHLLRYNREQLAILAETADDTAVVKRAQIRQMILTEAGMPARS